MRFSIDMDSRSSRAPARAWPSEDLVERLRRGKAELHACHSNLTLPEKVQIVLDLQRLVLPLLARHRPLRPWEQPWDIEP